MAELLICNGTLNIDQLKRECGPFGNAGMLGIGSHCKFFTPGRAYLLEEDSPSNRSIASLLRTASPIAIQNLVELSNELGPDALVAISEATKSLYDNGATLVGAGTSVYAQRTENFGKAVQQYQDALMHFRGTVEGNAAPADRTLAEQNVRKAFEQMQRTFQSELGVVRPHAKRRSRYPLRDVDRAVNIARSSRNVAKLDLMTQTQAHNLVKFAGHAKVLGTGLTAIDFGSRVVNIHTAYKAGGNWEREMFIESTSFAFSAVTGTAVMNAGVLLLGVTPFGLAGLIIGGVALAGVAGAASIGINNAMKNNAGGWYDAIMSWMGHR